MRNTNKGSQFEMLRVRKLVEEEKINLLNYMKSRFQEIEDSEGIHSDRAVAMDMLLDQILEAIDRSN